MNSDDPALFNPGFDGLNQSPTFETAWTKAQKKKSRRTYGRANSQIGGKRRTKDKKVASSSERFSHVIHNDSQPTDAMDSVVFVSLPNAQSLQRKASSLTLSSSAGSFRLSSTSSLNDIDTSQENAHPNIITQLENDLACESPEPTLASSSTKAPSANFMKTRPRKIRHIENVVTLANSFSDLANAPPSSTDWIQPSTVRVFAAGDLDGLSPDRSVSTNLSSSRKRGVCDSLDDVMTTGIMRRSRSRLFSPEHSGLAIRRTSPGRTRNARPTIHVADSDGDDNADQESKSDDTNEEVGKSFDDEDLLPPFPVRRACHDLESAAFGERRHVEASSEDAVLYSMPSLSALKFIVKNLRKERHGTTIASFGGRTSWTVGIPGTWPQERRTSVLQWATSYLGFSLRPGGGNVTFLQISASKGADLLKSLEVALASHKQNKPNESTRKRKGELTGMVFSFDMSNTADFASPLQMSVQKPSKPLRRLSKVEQPLDSQLLNAMGALGVEESVDEQEDLGEKSIVHLVTLEQEDELLQSEIDDVDHIPETRPARHSGEHHVGGQLLVQHLHGLSPLPPRRNRRPKLSVTIPSVRQSSATSPHPMSAKSASQPMTFECLETPCVKRDLSSWGKGVRDWGAEKGCSDDIIRTLLARFETAWSAEGLCELGQDARGTFSGCLDLDFEAEDTEMQSRSETQEGDQEESLTEQPFLKPRFSRRQSVGATALAGLTLGEETVAPTREWKRLAGSVAKHKRVSLCVNFRQGRTSVLGDRRTTAFASQRFSILEEQSLSLTDGDRFVFQSGATEKALPSASPFHEVMLDSKLFKNILAYLRENELMTKASLVSTRWADMVVEAHSTLMLQSVGCDEGTSNEEDFDDNSYDEESIEANNTLALSMERPWKYLTSKFPWACFLSEGAFKRVYRVWNSDVNAEEAVSVMDIDLIASTNNKQVIGAELAVSAMLSSLVRRNVCPNFVVTRGVFTCPYEPPASHWGWAQDKQPRGARFSPHNTKRKPREPSKHNQGHYQYIRMELCNEGDAEEYIKRQPDEMVSTDEAAAMIFQVAFALHAAADRFCLKHYDLKLLNVFLQSIEGVESDFSVCRYGLGSHTYALRLPTERACIAKLADYGTAVVSTESNGAPATIGQFTTLENTPPEFMILGDAATQGHGHDAFGLGLCMLHLFTGHAPYEEILQEVTCPAGLKQKLRRIWESETSEGYDVIRSVILADVSKDERGRIIEGQPDEVLYDTLYRYLVLFGIPDIKFGVKEHPKVWRAIMSSLEGKKGKTYGKNSGYSSNRNQFLRDQRKYSLSHGNNRYIARARDRMASVDGAIELMRSLVTFEPEKRATAIEVMNSKMMEKFREDSNTSYDTNDNVVSYMAFATSC